MNCLQCLFIECWLKTNLNWYTMQLTPQWGSQFPGTRCMTDLCREMRCSYIHPGSLSSPYLSAQLPFQTHHGMLLGQLGLGQEMCPPAEPPLACCVFWWGEAAGGSLQAYPCQSTCPHRVSHMGIFKWLMLANSYSMIIPALRSNFLLSLCSSAWAWWSQKDQGPTNLGLVQIFNGMWFPATQFAIYKFLVTYNEDQSTEHRQRN